MYVGETKKSASTRILTSPYLNCIFACVYADYNSINIIDGVIKLKPRVKRFLFLLEGSNFYAKKLQYEELTIDSIVIFYHVYLIN